MGNIDKVIACLKELGIKPKMNDFKSKLVIQKSIYLLQCMGVKTGYPYGLHIRGTYSSKLTDDLYQNKDSVEKLSSHDTLSDHEIKLIAEFKNELGDLNPDILEIAATYAYLFENNNKNARDATIRVKEMKPYFSDMQFALGINRAKALVYTPTPEELKKMKDEFKSWEEA